MALESASFDFYTWLVMAGGKGASEIVFAIDKFKPRRWSPEVLMARFRSIIEPGPALLGLKHTFGKDGRRHHGPLLSELVAYHKDGKKFPRLRTVLPPGKAKYTVTLRNNWHQSYRNSNEEAWRTFADEIGAVVIEDYETKPIHMHERMALYAGAEMNFGIVNGPMHCIVLSEYPMMMFGCNKSVLDYVRLGIPNGTSYPWHRPNQFCVWESDDLPVIRKHFDIWKTDGLRRAV